MLNDLVNTQVAQMLLKGHLVKLVSLSPVSGLSASQVLVTLLLSQGVKRCQLTRELVYFVGSGYL